MNNFLYSDECELLDLVDQKDEVIGCLPRAQVYAQKLSNFRVINAFLINDSNQIWIPRRTGSKKLFPLCLDASVGGHVMSGETYDQAFSRELKEELNLDSSQVSYQMLGRLTPHINQVSAFMQIYLIKTNISPNYNRLDFNGASWYDIAVLQNLIKQGEPTKGDLPVLIDFLQKHVFYN